jgi:hypothetical protein
LGKLFLIIVVGGKLLRKNKQQNANERPLKISELKI